MLDDKHFFRDFFENAPVGFHIFGPDRIIVDINQTELDMIGYSRAEIVGKKTWADLIIPQQRKRFEKHWHDITTEGKVYNLEYTLVHKNGSCIDVILNASARFDEAGTLINTRGSVVNITDRKLADEVLRLRDRAIDAVTDGIVITRYKRKANPIIYVNPAFERITGYSFNEVADKDCRFLQGKDHNQPQLQELKDAIHHQRGCRVILRNYRKDGTLFWNELTISPVRNDAGRLTHFVGIISDITKSKKTEENLQQSEKRFRELFDNISSGVAVYKAIDDGKNFVFEDFNLAAQRMDKVSKEQIMGKKVTDVFPGVKEMGLFEVFQRVFKTGKLEHHPVSFYKDKRLVGWRENYVYKLPSGEIVAVYNDITERKQAEEALQASEANYRQIFNAANDCIFVHDADNYRILDCNRKACEAFDYTCEEMQKLNVSDISADEPAYSRENAVQLIKKAAVGQPQLFEWMCKSKTGTLFWVEINLKAAVIGGKKRVLAVIRNIADRKRAELAIRLSEQRFRAIANYTYDWESWVSPQGRLLWVNPAVERITGYSIQQCMEMRNYPIPILHEEDRGIMTRVFDSALTGSRGTGLQFRLNHKNGSVVWADISWQPIYDEKGAYQGYRSSIRDVTDRKWAEDEIARLAKFPDENPNPVLRISTDGTVLYYNRASRPILKAWQCDLGQPLSGQWYRYLQDVTESAKPRQAQVDCDGRTFSLTFAPVHDADYVNIYALDITQQKVTDKNHK